MLARLRRFRLRILACRRRRAAAVLREDLDAIERKEKAEEVLFTEAEKAARAARQWAEEEAARTGSRNPES